MYTPRRSHLAWLLRLAGAVLFLAWPTIFLPTAWQAALHDRLGLGAFPASPLVDYLSRSIAVLYGTRGVVYWVLASDVLRYLPLIRLFAWMDMIGGVLILGIGLHAGLPIPWVASEGPPLVAFGLLFLWMCGRVEEAEEATGA